MTNEHTLENFAQSILLESQDALDIYQARHIAEALTSLGYRIVSAEEIPEAGAAPIADPRVDRLLAAVRPFLKITIMGLGPNQPEVVQRFPELVKMITELHEAAKAFDE